MSPAEIIRQILAGIAAARRAAVECYPPAVVWIDGVPYVVSDRASAAT